MMHVPDAPYIREAERRGTDYMYEYVYGVPVGYEVEEDADEDTLEDDEV